jgi:hypothetical protein
MWTSILSQPMHLRTTQRSFEQLRHLKLNHITSSKHSALVTSMFFNTICTIIYTTNSTHIYKTCQDCVNKMINSVKEIKYI